MSSRPSSANRSRARKLLNESEVLRTRRDGRARLRPAPRLSRLSPVWPCVAGSASRLEAPGPSQAEQGLPRTWRRLRAPRQALVNRRARGVGRRHGQRHHAGCRAWTWSLVYGSVPPSKQQSGHSSTRGTARDDRASLRRRWRAPPWTPSREVRLVRGPWPRLALSPVPVFRVRRND